MQKASASDKRLMLPASTFLGYLMLKVSMPDLLPACDRLPIATFLGDIMWKVSTFDYLVPEVSILVRRPGGRPRAGGLDVQRLPVSLPIPTFDRLSVAVLTTSTIAAAWWRCR